MPAPGDQHSRFQNPFEEPKPRLSVWTAQEIATLQSRLDRQLGPEYLSARSGPSGQKVHYVAADKIITLANEVFGFNGWSTSIQDVQMDFVDEQPHTGKISLGLSVTVRVTLRDGTYHEDMGYGHIENCKSKAAAFEKAKKEGTTDALKRAMRHFGNLLGNCIYDKTYLAKVTKIKVAPTKFDEENLHRHADYVKKEEDAERPRPDASAATSVPVAAHPDSFDDYLGELTEADFCVMEADTTADELTLPDVSHPNSNSSNTNTNSSNTNTNSSNTNTNSSNTNTNSSNTNTNSSNNGGNKAQGMQTSNNANQRPMQPPPRQPPPRQPPGGPGPMNHQARPPQTPNQPSARPGLNSGPPNNQAINNGQRPQPPQGNQGKPPAPQAGSGIGQRPADNANSGPPQHTPPAPPTGVAGGDGPGFFSARAVPRLPANGSNSGPVPITGQPFNPKAESPSIRKTPGIDHNTSRPVSKTGQHVAPATSSQVVNDKPSLGAVTGMRDAVSRPQQQQQQPSIQSPQMHPGRPNVLNPQLDHSRRIGAPGGPGSPLSNRGQYKPPTMMKRPPLVDVPNGTTNGPGNDVKRMKLN